MITRENLTMLTDFYELTMANGYLNYDADLIKDYEEVVRNMLTARNLLIKISISEDVTEAARFKDYFRIAKEKEVAVLLEVLSRLDQRAK